MNRVKSVSYDSTQLRIYKLYIYICCQLIHRADKWKSDCEDVLTMLELATDDPDGGPLKIFLHYLLIFLFLFYEYYRLLCY